MTTGLWVYRNSAGKYALAQADGTVLEAGCLGMIIDEGTGLANGWGTIVTSGPVDLGAATANMSNRTGVLLSATAGEIMAATDANIGALSAGDFHCHIGVARSTDILEIAIQLHTTAVT